MSKRSKTGPRNKPWRPYFGVRLFRANVMKNNAVILMVCDCGHWRGEKLSL